MTPPIVNYEVFANRVSKTYCYIFFQRIYVQGKIFQTQKILPLRINYHTAKIIPLTLKKLYS